MRDVKIVTGPTCSGKSALAMEIAVKSDAEIISCDSVQIYRGMDIGSAKPDAVELRKIPHHLIDVAYPDEKFDVWKYVELARKAFDDILSRGKSAVVVGGSGFYLRSWFLPVTDSVKIPREISEKCAEIEADGGVAALSRELLRLDPYAGKSVDILNPRRTIKALERCMASGKSCSELSADFAALPCPMGDLRRDVVFLNPPDDEIFKNIERRTADMIKSGLVEETKRLLEAGIEKNPSARNSIGYRETIDFIKSGSSDIEALSEEINSHTRALVKKQRKYFKNSLKLVSR